MQRRQVVGRGRALVLGVVLLATTACAARGNAFTAKFITEGTPSVNVGGIETPVFGQAPRPPRALPPPVPGVQTVASRASSNLSSLESVSPALRQALAALAVAPTSARYLDVATAYTRAGVPDLAYDHLIEGLRHDKTSVALHDALARVWRDWGFPERALSSANAAVFFGPRSPEARNTLGTILWALGQREGARQAFEASAALDGGATYAFRNLCMVALTAGRTAESVALCQRAKARQRSSKERPR